MHETQPNFFQIMALCYYISYYTGCIVATINIHINNTIFYKGYKKKKNCAFSITGCNPFAFKILII